MMSDCGAKPAAILGQLTVEYLKLCKRPGITAQKRPEGGLAGACCPQACDGLFSRVFLAFSLFSRISTCFLHVFFLFSSIFLHIFQVFFICFLTVFTAFSRVFLVFFETYSYKNLNMFPIVFYSFS